MKNIPVVIASILLIFAIPLGLTPLENIVFFLSLIIIINSIQSFGKSIWSVLDLMIVLAIITWNLSPLIAYHYFNQNNHLAILWDKAMRVDSNTYYSFVFPGTLAMILGIKTPINHKFDWSYPLNKLRKIKGFKKPLKVGIHLIIIGTTFSMLRPYLPSSLSFVAYLFEKLTFVGLLYVYFSGTRPKPYILFIAISILLFNSIRSGMFGELVYMVSLGVILISLGNNLSIFSKTTIIALGVFSLLVIQSIKYDYRQVAWNSGANFEYFMNLVIDNATSPSKITEEYNLFKITTRVNQGWLISATMARVPSVVPFANGETIYTSILASIIPRALWPDKPKSGGEANLERFLGWRNLGFSMNLGPIGEAWANFGLYGGIIFMFFYGLFFRVTFNYLIKLCYTNPTLILWIPLLFFYVIRTESDILTGFNHLLKTSMFIFVLYKLYPRITGIKL